MKDASGTDSLCTSTRPSGAVERVAGGILAALCEPREQESRGRGYVDLDAWRDAQAGNAAHR